MKSKNSYISFGRNPVSKYGDQPTVKKLDNASGKKIRLRFLCVAGEAD